MRAQKSKSLKPLPPRMTFFQLLISYIFYITLFFDYIISPYKYFIKSLFLLNDFTYETFFSIIYFIHCIFDITHLDKSSKYNFVISFCQNGLLFNLIVIIPFYYISIDYLYIRIIMIYRYPLLISNTSNTIYFFFSRFLTNYRTAKNLSEILSFLINLFFILHFFSCIYIYIGTNSVPSWLDPIRHYDSKEQYMVCLYIIMQTFTTVGFGDYPPQNPTEQLFVMFCLIVNCGLFAYWISRIISIITYKERIFDLNIDKSTHYIRGLPFNEYNEVRQYINYFLHPKYNLYWFKKYPFLKQIKPVNRKELISQAYKKLFTKFENFFENFNISTKCRLIENLETLMVNANYVPLKQNDYFTKIYFIMKGEVSIFKEGIYVQKIGPGEFFGDFFILTKRSEYTFKVEEGEQYEHDKVYLFYTLDIVLLGEILSYDQNGFIKFYQSTKNKRNLLKYQTNIDIINESSSSMDEDDYEIKLVKEKKLIRGRLRTEYLGNIPDVYNRFNKKKNVLNEEINQLEKRLDIINKQLSFIDNEIINQNKGGII